MSVRERNGGESGLSFDLLFYFLSAYRPQTLESIVRRIEPWLIGPNALAQFESIPAEHATYAQVSDATLGSAAPIDINVDSLDFRKCLSSQYLSSLQTRLRKGSRRIVVSPFLDPDNTSTIELSFFLRPGEESLPTRDLMEVILGERKFLDLLDGVDSFWTAIGVEAPVSTLAGLLGRSDHLPYEGKYGTQLLDFIGHEEFVKTLNGCPKVEPLPTGGLFFCWSWVSVPTEDSPRYGRFIAQLSVFENKLRERIEARPSAAPG